MTGITHNFGDLAEKLRRTAPLAKEALLPVMDQAYVEAMGRRKIPKRSGRLRDSLTKRAHRDHIARISGDRVTLGTRVPYAKYQKKRWRPLSRDERQAILVDPLQALVRAWLGGSPVPTQGGLF